MCAHGSCGARIQPRAQQNCCCGSVGNVSCAQLSAASVLPSMRAGQEKRLAAIKTLASNAARETRRPPRRSTSFGRNSGASSAHLSKYINTYPGRGRGILRLTHNPGLTMQPPCADPSDGWAPGGAGGPRRAPGPEPDPKVTISRASSMALVIISKRLPIVLPILQPPSLTSPFIAVAASIAAVARPWPSSSLQNRCC